MVLFCSVSLQAQIKFFNTYSNKGFDKGEGIVQLSDSSYLLIGSSTSFFEGPSQFFIARVDSAGTLIWSRDVGGSEVDNGKRILVLDSTFYAFGTSSSNPTGDFDFQMVKGGIDGSLNGTLQFTHGGWDFLNDVLLLPDSTFILAGYTNNTADGKKDGYYIKIDRSGNVLQNIQSNRIKDDEIHSLYLLDDSTYVMAGYRYNADSSLTKAFIRANKLNGNLVWEMEYGDNGPSCFYDVLVTQHGLYGTGTVLRGPNLLEQPYYVRLDLSGGIIEQNIENINGKKWAKQLIQISGFNYFMAMETDDDFTFGEGTDVGYYAINETLDLQGSAVSVQVDLTDEHGEAIPTNDGGFIAIGTTEKFGEGEKSVYLVKAFKNNYPDMTLPVGYNLLDLNEKEWVESAVYPNPVTNQLTLHFDFPVKGKLMLFNLEGQLIIDTPIDSENEVLDLGSFKPGFYLLQLSTDKGSATHRIVKQ